MSGDRRLEGPRNMVSDEKPAHKVRVTGHLGDEYQPSLVRIWSGDGDKIWSFPIEVDPLEAMDVARAIQDAATKIISEEGE